MDFGGSFTEGWVKSDAKETRDGDLQGLRGIVEFSEDSISLDDLAVVYRQISDGQESRV